MGRWDYYRYYEPTRPRQVKGGIKAQSRVGGFGKSWWAKRWIGVLESFQIGARLSRGKNYARSGQVISIEVSEGRVTAQVQGSRPRPYEVSIAVKTIAAAGWKKAIAAMATEAVFAAKLLNGQMPQDIERAFAGPKISLFPASLRELDTECSCPDWSNPCKHIAAVYYLLGEEFDRDPFLIFRLRGMGRESLLKALAAARKSEGGGQKGRAGGGPQGAGQSAAEALPRSARGRRPAGGEAATAGGVAEQSPLPVEPGAFWGEAADFAFPEAGESPAISPCFGLLGSFPFWRGRGSFREAVEEVYRRASPMGMDIFLGQARPER